MNKLKYQNKSDSYIELKYYECLNYLNSLNETLDYLPVNSILGRMGVIASINAQQVKLDVLRAEMNKRGLLSNDN